MSGWNFDISQAPRGKMVAGTIGKRDIMRFAADRVILATKCGKVTLSHFIPDEERWLMLGKNEQPDAWMPWPTHPHSQPHPLAGSDSPTSPPPQPVEMSGSPIPEQKP